MEKDSIDVSLVTRESGGDSALQSDDMRVEKSKVRTLSIISALLLTVLLMSGRSAFPQIAGRQTKLARLALV